MWPIKPNIFAVTFSTASTIICTVCHSVKETNSCKRKGRMTENQERKQTMGTDI